MKNHYYHFAGRGTKSENHEESCRIIECTSGTVFAIIVTYGGVGFVLAHCRRAIIDRWGLYCHDPFRRASDAGLTRSWAEPCHKGLFLFRPARLDIVTEQDWMQRTD